MKIAIFNQNRVGVAQADQVIDITELIGWNPERVQDSLVLFMSDYDKLKPQIEQYILNAPSSQLSGITLQAPVPNPSKIVAAPVNYLLHQDEMNAQFNNAEFTIEHLGFFLKAPSSIVGPGATVKLPFKDRRTDHEAEIAFVISKEAKDVSASEASTYIFGYFALMDITVRGKEDRPWRKSFDTFTPIGPWIVTRDELENPHELDLRLWVNNELRQSANTRHLIYNCYKFLEVVSKVMTLYPGDILTTGTPEGVGAITRGDKVRISIDRIGEFSVDVDYK